MTPRLIGAHIRNHRYAADGTPLRSSHRSTFEDCIWFDHPLVDGTHSKALFRNCKFDSLHNLHLVQTSIILCRAWYIENCQFIGSRVHQLFVKAKVRSCRFELSLIQNLSARGVIDSYFELCRVRLHPQEASVWENCHFVDCQFDRLGKSKFRNCQFIDCRFPDGTTTLPPEHLLPSS